MIQQLNEELKEAEEKKNQEQKLLKFQKRIKVYGDKHNKIRDNMAIFKQCSAYVDSEEYIKKLARKLDVQTKYEYIQALKDKVMTEIIKESKEQQSARQAIPEHIKKMICNYT